jgi:hypothetical protein
MSDGMAEAVNGNNFYSGCGTALYNVTSAKLWMVVLWPIHMGSLLFRLTVNKAL